MIVGDGECGYVFRGEFGVLIVVVAVRMEAKNDWNFCQVMKMKTDEKKMGKRNLREEGGPGIFSMWDFLYFL